MKPTYYAYGVIIVLVVIVAYLLGKGQGAPVDQGLSTPDNQSSQTSTNPPVGTKTTTAKPTSTTKTSYVPTSGIGSIFTPPANVIHLPLYYDVSSTTDTIRLATPSQGTGVASPLTVAGLARGQWFFEGSFPVVLVDAKRRILAKGVVTAQNDWMTNDFVAFRGTLTFAHQGSATVGAIYLLNDNPSGNPGTARAAMEPVVFQ